MPPVFHRTGQQAPNVNRLGTQVASDLSHNCLTCQRFNVCRDPNRVPGSAFRYRCTRYQEPAPADTSFLEAGITTTEAIADPGRMSLVAPRTIEGLIDAAEERRREQTLISLLDEALSDQSVIRTDLKFDDRDLPQPLNYFQWVRDPNMSNLSMDLYSMQHKICAEYFSEYCPRCSDLEFLEEMVVDTPMPEFEDRVMLLQHGVCPNCGARRSELVANEELNEHYQLAGLAGQRSGKTAMAIVNESYCITGWLKTPNPQRLFSTLPNQKLTCTYAALTLGQVNLNFWDPFVELLRNSPWYRDYHALLRHYGEQAGEDLLSFKESWIEYRHRNMHLLPSGPNKRTMRGNTRARALVDELGWFPFGRDAQELTKMSAEQVMVALDNSMATIQGAHWGLLMQGYDNLPRAQITAISSPQEVNDHIMKLNRDYGPIKTAYTFKYATWEINPKLPREGPWMTAKFAANERDAMRDFGCEPPMSSSSWISEIENVADTFEERPNNFAILQRKFRSASGVYQTGGSVEIKQRRNSGRVMALDPGYSGNHFAICIAALDLDDNPVIEGIGELIPASDAKINFTQIYNDILLPLATGCGVQVVVSDRWQSIKLLQDLEAAVHTLYNDNYKCKYNDFDDLRERCYDQRISLPRLEMETGDILMIGDNYPTGFMRKPCAHLFYQMFTVRDYPGKTVEKGADSTDDLFRTVVLANKALQDPEILEVLRKDTSVRRAKTLGVVRSFSAQGSTNNAMGSVSSRGSFGGSGGSASAAGVASRSGAGISRPR